MSMNTFKILNDLLTTIMGDSLLHAKWLNTLSFLENCGARKIAACEHPTLVREEMLKHAAEEFRHAHYLKKQQARLGITGLYDYSLANILGGFSTLHYINMLDVKTRQYLIECGLDSKELAEGNYLLVTYAIEKRAEQLYPLYHERLKEYGSKITVKSIVMEEHEHLEEMTQQLHLFAEGPKHMENVCAIESRLYSKWLAAVAKGSI